MNLENPQAPFLFLSILDNAPHCRDISLVLGLLVHEFPGGGAEVVPNILAKGKHASKLLSLLKYLLEKNKTDYYHLFPNCGDSSRKAITNLIKIIIDNAAFADKIEQVIKLINTNAKDLLCKDNPQAEKNFEMICEHAKVLDVVREKIVSQDFTLEASSRLASSLSQEEFQKIMSDAINAVEKADRPEDEKSPNKSQELSVASLIKVVKRDSPAHNSYPATSPLGFNSTSNNSSRISEHFI